MFFFFFFVEGMRLSQFARETHIFGTDDFELHNLFTEFHKWGFFGDKTVTGLPAGLQTRTTSSFLQGS